MLLWQYILLIILKLQFLLQTLAMLFKKKRSLLNSHILHLTFSLVGTVDSGRENTSIPNVSAFEDLLCDLEVRYFYSCQYLYVVKVLQGI